MIELKSYLIEIHDDFINTNDYVAHNIAIITLLTYMPIDVSIPLVPLGATKLKEIIVPIINKKKMEILDKFKSEIYEREYFKNIKTNKINNTSNISYNNHILNRENAISKINDLIELLKLTNEVQKVNNMITQIKILNTNIMKEITLYETQYIKYNDLKVKCEDLTKCLKIISDLNTEISNPLEQKIYMSSLENINNISSSIPINLIGNRINALYKLKSLILSPIKQLTHTNIKLNCPACMEETEKMRYNMGCGHIFCGDCEPKLNKCPCCRAIINSKPLYINSPVDQPTVLLNQPMVLLNQPTVPLNQPTVLLNQPMVLLNQPMVLNQPLGVPLNQPTLQLNQPPVLLNHQLDLLNQIRVSLIQPTEQEERLLDLFEPLNQGDILDFDLQ